MLQKHGKSLNWDCVYVDAFESTVVNKSAVRADSAANSADTFKRTKYGYLTECYQLEAVSFETAGTYSGETKNIACAIGRRLIEATGLNREIFWLVQRLSLEV